MRDIGIVEIEHLQHRNSKQTSTLDIYSHQ